MKYLFILVLLSIIIMGCDKTVTAEESKLSLEELSGKFYLDVRTASDNAYIDWFNAHSEEKAWWNKLGANDMEIFLFSEKESIEQHWAADRGVSCGVQYQGHLGELTEYFGHDLKTKYKDKKIVRAIDTVGFLKALGVTPKILNKHYVRDPVPARIHKKYKTWWSVTVSKDTTFFKGRSFAEAFAATTDPLEKANLMKSLKNSIQIEYADSDKTKTQDNPFLFALTPKNITFSIACDFGQIVTLSLKDGEFPDTKYTTFMAFDADQPGVFSPHDPTGAKIQWK